MAKRNRGRKMKHKAEQPVEDPAVRQLALDFTPEQGMEMLFEAGDLAGRIESLKAVAKTSLSEARDLKKKLDAILLQAGAKKRTVEVGVYDKVDVECSVVRTFRKDTDEEIAFRAMTPEEIKSGVVLNPAQAAEALAHVAAAAGETPAEGDFTFTEDDPAPSNVLGFTPVERAGMEAGA